MWVITACLLIAAYGFYRALTFRKKEQPQNPPLVEDKPKVTITFERIITADVDGDAALALYRQSRDYQAKKDYTSAINTIKEAIISDNRNAYRFTLSDYHQDNKEPELALQVLIDMLSELDSPSYFNMKHIKRSEIHKRIANFYRRDKNPVLAVAHLSVSSFLMLTGLALQGRTTEMYQYAKTDIHAAIDAEGLVNSVLPEGKANLYASEISALMKEYTPVLSRLSATCVRILEKSAYRSYNHTSSDLHHEDVALSASKNVSKLCKELDELGFKERVLLILRGLAA